MKVKSFLVFALFLLVNQHCTVRAEGAVIPSETTNELHHGWQYISYPFLKYQETNQLTFWVTPNEGRELRLDIMTYSVQPPAMLKKGNVSARLHRANGQAVDIEEKYRTYFEHSMGAQAGMSLDGGMDFSIMALFSWGTNALAESWFEIHIGNDCYWVELPYGFDQNPKDLPVATVAGGPPKFDPAMKSLGAHDHVVRWEKVHYYLSHIQNDWAIELNQSNPYRGESEVILYREDHKNWDLFTPRTSVRLLHADGTTSTGSCVQLRLPDDSMRRNDTFVLGCQDDGTRSWDQLEISVDDKSYRTVIPSSLYKMWHGHAPDQRGH